MKLDPETARLLDLIAWMRKEQGLSESWQRVMDYCRQPKSVLSFQTFNDATSEEYRNSQDNLIWGVIMGGFGSGCPYEIFNLEYVAYFCIFERCSLQQFPAYVHQLEQNS